GKSIAQTGRSKLQNQRAGLNNQILKAMRMRAGAENLLRATTNNKVREQVLLELSYVNSNLQVLKEELERLNISVEDFILEHYSEDGADYENELADLMDLRQTHQVMRGRPS
ncbi:hypothetical protein AB205_0034610, partial [Aquarana catesbeiana]